MTRICADVPRLASDAMPDMYRCTDKNIPLPENFGTSANNPNDWVRPLPDGSLNVNHAGAIAVALTKARSGSDEFQRLILNAPLPATEKRAVRKLVSRKRQPKVKELLQVMPALMNAVPMAAVAVAWQLA